MGRSYSTWGCRERTDYGPWGLEHRSFGAVGRAVNGARCDNPKSKPHPTEACLFKGQLRYRVDVSATDVTITRWVEIVLVR